MKVLIIGGGVGGFAAALSLHQAGIECEIFEQSSSIRELGVGINTLPHAIKELADLGLLEDLARVAIRHIRRDANSDLKEFLKEKEITKDEEHDGEDLVQKLTDSKIKEIDSALETKEADLMEF